MTRNICLLSHIFNAIFQNHEMLDSNHNGSKLAFLEVYYIENHYLIINHDLKASMRYKQY